MRLTGAVALRTASGRALSERLSVKTKHLDPAASFTFITLSSYVTHAFASRQIVNYTFLKPNIMGYQTLRKLYFHALERGSHFNNDRQPEMATKTGNIYIYKTRRDSIEIQTTNLGFTTMYSSKIVLASDCNIDSTTGNSDMAS